MLLYSIIHVSKKHIAFVLSTETVWFKINTANILNLMITAEIVYGFIYLGS
jgi:hypothetical protein